MTSWFKAKLGGRFRVSTIVLIVAFVALFVLPGDAARGLSRPWVYTAFSRGERHLSVVHGVDQALPRAVAEIPVQERTTRLRPLLEALPAPDASVSAV